MPNSIALVFHFFFFSAGFTKESQGSARMGRSENIKTEQWESREHEESMMKSIRKKGKGKAEGGRGEQRSRVCICGSERREEMKRKKKERKKSKSDRGRESRGEKMICCSLQRASLTGMALQGSMKSLLIVRSGN